MVWDSAIPAGCRNHVVVSAQQLGNRVWCGTHSNCSWLPEPFCCERTTTWKPYLVWDSQQFQLVAGTLLLLEHDNLQTVLGVGLTVIPAGCRNHFVLSAQQLGNPVWCETHTRQRSHSNSSLPPELCCCEHATTTNLRLPLAHTNSSWLPELLLRADRNCKYVLGWGDTGSGWPPIPCCRRGSIGWHPEQCRCRRPICKTVLAWFRANSGWQLEPCRRDCTTTWKPRLLLTSRQFQLAAGTMLLAEHGNWEFVFGV